LKVGWRGLKKGISQREIKDLVRAPFLLQAGALFKHLSYPG